MFFKMVFNQARQKWVVTGLLFLAMASLVVLYVYLGSSTRFVNRAMQLIMKNMGLNLILLPEQVDPLDTYRCTERQALFADEATRELAKHTRLSSKYYVSVLQQMVPAHGHDFILTGMEPVNRPDETTEKGNPITPISSGHARIGSAAANILNLGPGKRMQVLGRSFRVDDALPAKGSLDDYRIYVDLTDCQELVGRKGLINMILAFQCLEEGGTLADIEKRQRENLAEILPGFKQITMMDIAKGRFMARLTTQRYLYYLLGLVLCITVVVIAATGLQEVSERRKEVGIMISMGTGYTYIVGLYVTKILLVALAASGAGFLIGSQLSVWLTKPFLVYETRPVAVIWQQLPRTMLLTCLVAVGAEIIPILKLLSMDPNSILTEE